jgi:transcriptional regulator with XRE-family HTH domain
MKFDNLLSDDAVLRELGARVAATRLDRGLTQAQLASAAGVSKRTVERLEDGESAQLASFVRCLRALGRLEGLDRLLPALAPNPVDLLKRDGAMRRRAAGSRGGGASVSSAGPSAASPSAPWTWGDEGADSE